MIGSRGFEKRRLYGLVASYERGLTRAMAAACRIASTAPGRYDDRSLQVARLSHPGVPVGDRTVCSGLESVGGSPARRGALEVAGLTLFRWGYLLIR